MFTNEEKQAATAGTPPIHRIPPSPPPKPPLVMDCPAYERTMRLQSMLATVILSLGCEGGLDYNDRHHLRDVVRFIFDEAEVLGGEIEEMMLAG